MTQAAWRVVPFDERFDASDFVCLDDHLTAYLREGRALRDLSSGQAAIFLLVDAVDRVQGYYTLSAASIDRKSQDLLRSRDESQ